MKVIHTRNVHSAIPEAVFLLESEGIVRDSRYGKVIVVPEPVTTVYEKPLERVVFWPQRDANPFLHLYESLWMLAGRNDVVSLSRYAKKFLEFSDDGKVLHDAYGYRWRRAFGIDQLAIIARILKDNPNDRRAVLQMWDVHSDLGFAGRAYPCNLVVTFQRGFPAGELNMTVFNRSNDIVLGCYGSNAVHFAFLLEYMALWVGCPVGTYTQVSVNWHAYLDNLEKIKKIPHGALPYLVKDFRDPYAQKDVWTVPLLGSISRVDELIRTLLEDADTGYSSGSDIESIEEPWARIFYAMFMAHHIWKTYPEHEKWLALEALEKEDSRIDWIVAAKDWLKRRIDKKVIEQAKDHETLGEA